MSEEKVIQHAEKAVHAIGNKKKNWKERIKEFLLEIFIIVIAVSITLWFHNWNDRLHEKKLAKEFLIDLRKNLKENKVSMDTMINYFSDVMLKSYDAVLFQIKNNKVDANFIDANTRNLLFFRSRNFDLGLFESFKSSGNLRVLENQELLTDIVTVYSTSLPFRETQIRNRSTDLYDSYDHYIGTKCGAIDPTYSSIKLFPHLKDPDVLYFLQKNATGFSWLIDNLKGTLSSMDTTLKEIETELKDRYDYTPDDNNKNEK